MNGFIKLHRQLIEWEWYSDIKVCRVFLHLLLTANFKDGNWRGYAVKRGQVIIGKESLGKTLGLSIQEVKTVFKKLKKTGEIATKATNKFVIVTVCNFDSYQDKEAIEKETATNKKPTSNQQATSEQPQRKNEKKDKKDKKERIKEKELVDLPFSNEVREILKFFISKTGNQLRISAKDSILGRSDKYKKIMPRLKDGATVEECKAIISLKSKQWKNDKAMKAHLCIPTLFRASNFEKYLDEVDSLAPSEGGNEKKFTYPLPNFKDPDERWYYFYTRYNAYKPFLDEQLKNTVYRKRAVTQKDAEGLCFELELKFPNLLDIDFKYVPQP